MAQYYHCVYKWAMDLELSWEPHKCQDVTNDQQIQAEPPPAIVVRLAVVSQ